MIEKNSEKVNVRGVYFDNLTFDEAVQKAIRIIETDGFSYAVTPNSEIVQMCVENPTIFDAVNTAELVIPDGIGVVYASKILKTPLKERVAGVELAEKVIEYAANNGKKLYFFGGKKKTDTTDAVWQLAAEKLLQRYPGLVVCGRDGYFDDAETDDIIKDINASGAEILFVCLGAPKQEKWMYKNRAKFENVRFAAGLGGSLDVFAGVAKRAPEFYQKHGLEWLFRLQKQPSRIGRMMKIPKFIAQTIVHGNNVQKN